jgi:AcrR family transcriptional regulator
MSLSPSVTKPVRADARRNYEALVAAGKAVFLRAGADAPMEEVAKKAGVGQGTLYRHFPSREHLFVAIMKDRVDLLDTQARALLDAPDTWQALTEWLRLYDRSAAEFRGLSARVGDGLADDSSPVAAACAPMKATFADLLARAHEEGTVRTDVTALQILTMVAALPKPAVNDEADTIYLDIVLRGLKPHA